MWVGGGVGAGVGGELGDGEREKWDERDKHERESSGKDLPLILNDTRLM